jgi:RNA polymerase sigma-70 factor (TIGR02960 family)
MATSRARGSINRVTRSTLEAARAGDEQAFRDLIDPHLRELHVHCYRMLGSLVDAEDLLQETLTAAWRGLDGFAGRSSLRTWLYRIATNRCLNAIRDAKRHHPTEPVPPFDPPEPSRRGEVTWLQPYPDRWLDETADTAPGPEAGYQARETIELAFIAALQQLPPRQTAALLLCDVLGFATAEAATMLDTSPTAVKGALQRARATLDHERARAPRQATPDAGPPDTARLARRFAEAFSRDDIDAIIALLTEDAWLAMPPAPHEYHGAEAVASFLRASAAWRGQRRLWLLPTEANTQPAFGSYLSDSDSDTAHPTGILVLTLSGHQIRTITRFIDPELPRHFGLPDVLDP